MIRTAAVVILILILLVFFQPQIKSFILETRMSITLSKVEVDDDLRDQLDRAIHRIGTGMEEHRFTDIELTTLLGLLDEMSEYKGREMSNQEAQRLLRRMEVVLQRYNL